MLSRFSCVRLFVTLWTGALQALSMGFSRRELPYPPPGELPNPGIEPVTLKSPELADRFFTTNATWPCLHVQVWLGRVRGSVAGDAVMEIKGHMAVGGHH